MYELDRTNLSGFGRPKSPLNLQYGWTLKNIKHGIHDYGFRRNLVRSGWWPISRSLDVLAQSVISPCRMSQSFDFRYKSSRHKPIFHSFRTHFYWKRASIQAVRLFRMAKRIKLSGEMSSVVRLASDASHAPICSDYSCLPESYSPNNVTKSRTWVYQPRYQPWYLCTANFWS